MSIHETIYKTLNLTDEEVMSIIGAGDLGGVKSRRDGVRTFIKSHKWSEESYKAWLHDGQWTPDQPARGLGDRVAKVTNTLGIKACGGCGKRQKTLNTIFPNKD